MTAFVLGLPETKVRVIAPDVGGGFGSKIYLYAEETALVWASQAGQPADQVGGRSQRGVPVRRARPRPRDARRARAATRTASSSRCACITTANMGAYLSTFASCIPTILYATLLAGQYTTPAIYCEVTASFTNTAPVDAYRGAGRPEATYVVERLVHQAAVDIGIRAGRNPPAQLHPQVPLRDAGGAHLRHRQLRRDARRGDEDGRRRRLRGAQGGGREARQAARHRAMRRTSRRAGSRRRTSRARSARARACSRRAQVRVNPTGSVTVFTGSHSHGQGHETTFAQIVAAKLGIDIGNVEVVHGDTGRIPFGMGTYGSRSLAVGGTAIVKALDKVIAKGKKIAAHLLEAAESRHRVQGRQVHRGRHRPQQGVRRSLAGRVRAAQLSARQAGAGPRRNRVLRSDQLHLSRRARTSARSRSIRRPAW